MPKNLLWKEVKSYDEWELHDEFGIRAIIRREGLTNVYKTYVIEFPEEKITAVHYFSSLKEASEWCENKFEGKRIGNPNND